MTPQSTSANCPGKLPRKFPPRPAAGLRPRTFFPALCLVASALVALASTALAAPSQLRLHGKPNEPYVIEASSNLLHWSVIATGDADSNGVVRFSDPQSHQFDQRFYRGVRADTSAAGFRPDRILVKPRAGLTLSVPDLLLGAAVLQSFENMGGLQVVGVPDGRSISEALAILRQSGQVEYAEPDYRLQVQQLEPNDLRFQDGSLWGLHNSGQLDGVPDADIDAPEGWELQHAADPVIVAVIDTGIRYSHEDLASNLWVNPDEIPGNGLDDSGSGYIDDVHGINAILRNGDPDDDHGHGTHVAGIIGAVGNNETGVAGVAWRVQLMALKFINPQGDGSISDAIACIDYAREHGAHIINASWGSPTFASQALRDAIAAARDAGILFIAAAGNSSNDNDVNPLFPASYDLDNIISTAATTRHDELAFYSNHGLSAVDLGAPGHEIFSAWNDSDNSYQFSHGSSMAGAHVSGVAALLMARFPDEDYTAIKRRILEGADPLPALQDRCVTGGRLNLFNALSLDSPPPPPPPPRPTITVTASDPDAAEEGPDPGHFTIARNDDTGTSLTVHYALDGTADNSSDYEELSGSVTIPSGSETATVRVHPIDDSADEENETVVLRLTPHETYVAGSPDRATLVIADNDQPPQTPVARPTVTVVASTENASESGDVGVFTIQLSGPTTAPFTIQYSFGGHALNGVDYETIEESVTVPAGETSVDVKVIPINDDGIEIDEPVYLMLYGYTGAPYIVGRPDGATVTIADNDEHSFRPVVTAVASDNTASESGDPGVFTLHLSGSVSSPLTIQYSLGGHARNGTDYQRLPDTVTVPAGAASVDVRIIPIEDNGSEIDEPVYLMLYGYTGAPYIVGKPDGATVIIRDND